MLNRTRLEHWSPKRREQQIAYDRARQAVWNRDGGRCQAATVFPAVECYGRIDPHHIALTGPYPELRCDVDNMICVCRRHHDHIHHHPLEAKKAGLLR